MKTLTIMLTNEDERTDLSIISREGSVDVQGVDLRFVIRKMTARVEVVLPESARDQHVLLALIQALKPFAKRKSRERNPFDELSEERPTTDSA